MGNSVAMLIGMPAAFHVARITDRLRGRTSLPTDAEQGQIPPGAVTQIAEELDLAYPKGLEVGTKAKFVLQIFENVNSTPPGWFASFTLSGVYLASLATVLIAGSIFAFAQHADLRRFLAEHRPPHSRIGLSRGTTRGPSPARRSTESTSLPRSKKALCVSMIILVTG